jgi:hypothetical protein
VYFQEPTSKRRIYVIWPIGDDFTFTFRLNFYSDLARFFHVEAQVQDFHEESLDVPGASEYSTSYARVLTLLHHVIVTQALPSA